MVIFKDLFGQNEEQAKKDYFDYDEIPINTRFKTIYVIQENAYAYGEYTGTALSDLDKLRHLVCKNLGKRNISNQSSDEAAIAEWMERCSVKDFLNTIEMFLYIREKDRSHHRFRRLESTIQQINDIFDNDKIGYQIVETTSEHKIRRRDSEFLHEEVIKPTLMLLHNHSFKGASAEFEKALERYYEGDFPGTVQEAANAFESTMKEILIKMKIPLPPKPNAAPLIQTLYNNELLIDPTLNFANNLKEVLIGLPAVGNVKGRHGSLLPREKERSYAQFALHLCASFIVFLIQRYEEKKK